MNYELVNNITPGSDVWEKVKENVAKDDATVITLTAAPRFYGLLQDEGVKGINVLDHVTKRTYVPDQYRFFNDVPVPTWAKIDMTQDGSILVTDQGDVIAREYLFGNTRRAVQDVRYNNPDGTLDYIEEYAFDGTVFSNLFYSDNQLQEIVFYNSDVQPVVRYYFYESVINFITIEDPKTHAVLKDYANLEDFLVDQVAQLVTKDDTVVFHYMGVEMNSLREAKSHNVLEMAESVLDENGNVRGNLAMILQGQLDYIDEVRVDSQGYEDLKQSGVPMDRVVELK
ncbi:hypothetical protein D3P96_01445 [Weissella viridescens]|uniref:Accessory Sec system glycosyltransferase GtfB n=1 Tax=Weissella viridescens TaxID=1629 RepID=A0A3P2RDC9_WEIVI|nr:hypothetical protein [Weissella viridescens]RRG18677.1 hypothetical protein D3P96_01445 [Weissella viridescens]